MGEAGWLYTELKQSTGTHFALCWKGRLRYTVPRDATARKVCWKTFLPGWLELPLRVMARLPRVFGAISCVEAKRLRLIREAIGTETGLSCCRSGAPGPWSKDTILLLNRTNAEPLYVVKAGDGDAVDFLLRNEANWLRTLRDQPALADHIPELIADYTGMDSRFIAQRALTGKLDYNFGEPHIAFLRKLHEYSRQPMRFEESRLFSSMRSRMKDLDGLLSEEWAHRLEKTMLRIEQQFSDAAIVLVAAHNDFTPWNIRVELGIARIFDWELADYEQLPLFDALHFVAMPMALKGASTSAIITAMHKTQERCEHWFDVELCFKAQMQTLTYLMNLATLYLCAERGRSDSNLVMHIYGQCIDYLGCV